MFGRRIAIAVAAAAAVGVALVGPSSGAVAAPAVTHGAAVLAAQSDPDPILTNLKWDTIMADDWDYIDVFELISAPQVTAGGEYFLYDPDHQQVLEGFAIPGDNSQWLHTTTDWKQVMFYFTNFEVGTTKIEVRYGSVDDPQGAVVVGSAQQVT
jgi:hypothetical protein